MDTEFLEGFNTKKLRTNIIDLFTSANSSFPSLPTGEFYFCREVTGSGGFFFFLLFSFFLFVRVVSETRG